jgi:hypothetical protein
MDFHLTINRLVPGAITWKTERTKTLYVQFPDGSKRTFTRQTDALTYVRAYAKTQGHPVSPPTTDPYLLEVAEAIKAML